MNMKKEISILSLVGLICLVQSCAASPTSDKLTFNPAKYQKQELKYEGKTIKVRAYEKIVYVANPVDVNYEIMNIYIPEEYFNGKSVNGYTAETAPIFFPNQVGGYMPATPASTSMQQGMPPLNGRGAQDLGKGKPEGMPEGARPDGMGPRGAGQNGGAPRMMPPEMSKRPSVVLAALSQGYVVASAGARGRTTVAKDGTYTGKVPNALVDLKAAIRYLKYNDKAMPGDANKIISDGTSAGGAMSALLGATGNNPDYEPYLEKLGAAKATDNLFAVQAYCPITNLDHADMAYEWQFNGVNDYQASMMPPSGNSNNKSNTLTAAQIKASGELKAQFPDYVNSLNLKDSKGVALTLDKDGNGSFKDWVKSYVIASAQKALDSGTDLSAHTWLKIENKKVIDLDFDQYVRYMNRQKLPPAFDAFDLSTPENQEFGTEKIDKQHFTEYSQKNSTVSSSTIADQSLIKMLNPMYYIGQPNTTVSKYWRIRHGSKDKDTGLAIPVILGTYLQNKGYVVDLALPWDRPHSGDYDLDELFSWIDHLCK
jgi:hypothetical protein